MSKSADRLSFVSGACLAAVCLAFLAPLAAMAEDHEVQAVSHRGYESMFFEPGFLAIQPGDRVTFLVSDLDHQPQSVFAPAGADHWQAEKGQTTTVTFEREGVYIFDCAYHNVMGMAGVVLVGRPVNLEEARAFFEAYRERTFAMNKDRLDPVWSSNGEYLSGKPAK
jgi:pseudoazurin